MGKWIRQVRERKNKARKEVREGRKGTLALYHDHCSSEGRSEGIFLHVALLHTQSGSPSAHMCTHSLSPSASQSRTTVMVNRMQGERCGHPLIGPGQDAECELGALRAGTQGWS